MKTAKQLNKQFERFDATMDELLQVSHSEIKAKLDAEKAAKKRKSKSGAGGSRDKSN